jgi:arylformamidase
VNERRALNFDCAWQNNLSSQASFAVSVPFNWQSATDDEVDHQYSPSRHALRPLDEYLAEYHELSLPHDADALRQPRRPLLIYIHGGYWQRLSAADSLFNAEDAIAEGISLHAVEYTLAPFATVPDIIEECIAEVEKTIAELQPTQVVLAGCSAGAHLAAMCAREYAIASKLSGVVLLSGIYDLRPLVVTETNDPLRLTPESSAAISPQLLPPTHGLTQALCAVGESESSEFIRQNAEYADHLQISGTIAETMVVANRDHFNLPYDLLRRGTLVGDWTLAQLLKDKS